MDHNVVSWMGCEEHFIYKVLHLKKSQTWIIIWIHSFHELVLSDSRADFLIPMIYYLIYAFLKYILQYSIIHHEILKHYFAVV